MTVFRAALVALVVFVGSPVWGHGGLSMEDDFCKLTIGPDLMHFTGYQPDATSEREFCEDIPSTGRTVIVLDYLDEKLRDLPVEVRIIRDTGNESNLDAVTVFHQAPTVYGRGSVSVEHNFPEYGRFVGLVTVVEDPPKISRFPFAVGTGGSRTWMLYALFGAGAIAIGAVLYVVSARRA